MIEVDPGDFTDEAIRKVAPRCGDCPDGGDVDLAQGMIVYPQRPDLWRHDDGTERWWWLCNRCWGYVGVHKGTITPLGTPAGRETRRAREAAHAAFDPLWQKRMRLSGLSKTKARGRGYKWLAAQLGIDAKACHIGMLDAETARRVVEVCRAATKREES